MGFEPIAFLENHLLPCPIKVLTGCDCPGCGMQRAIIHCLNGEISESFAMHPAGIPCLLLVAFLFLHLKWKFKFGASVLRWSLLSIGIITITHYLIKIYYLGTCCNF